MEELRDEGEEEGAEDLLLMDDCGSHLSQLLLDVPGGGSGEAGARRQK